MGTEPKFRRVLLKISGEALAGDQKTGLNFNVIGRVCDVIKTCTELGVQVGVVIGGGNFWRGVKNGDKIGRVIGVIPVLGALGIAIGYAVVIGWFIKYLIEAACGTLLTQPDMAAFFGSRISSSGHSARLAFTPVTKNLL